MVEKRNHEPSVIINGQSLISGQIMALRAALGNFALQIESGSRDDLVGVNMAEEYSGQIKQIRNMLYKEMELNDE